jgi:rSAM/selenodomain-associated transferase 1
MKDNSETPDCRILVFAKAPISGEVKTRLIPMMKAEAATTLHKELVLHTLRVAVESKAGSVELWCTPSVEHPFFIQCAKKFKLELHRQTEGDLGRRMAYAFDKTLGNNSMALLVGTDCPSLTSDDLKEARKALEEGASAVISPVEDGGYVLIGLRQYEPTHFEGINWGTGSVLEETRERLRGLRWRWRELRERWDVDRPEDVERLRNSGWIKVIF